MEGSEITKLITVNLPETYIEGLDRLVNAHLYPNRAEAIRISIKDLLRLHGQLKPPQKVET